MSIGLGFGIIGCGVIAKRHANIILSSQFPEAKLCAVFDKDLKKAENFGQTYNAHVCKSLAELASMDEIDVLVVLVPSGLHAIIIKQIVCYGKPIIVEKPLALRVEDINKIIDVTHKHNCQLFVVKQNRFNLPVIELKKAISDGRFGKLNLGTICLRWSRNQSYYNQSSWRGTWKHDGGVLTNQASHHIDLLQWMMGDVDTVYAKSSKAIADIEAEDTAVVVVKFVSGALGIIEATTATRPSDLEGSLSILGDNGSVKIGGFSANKLETWAFSEKTKFDPFILENKSENPDHKFGYAHAAYYDHVIDCITNGKQPLVGPMEARKSMDLIIAIYESIENNIEVKLPGNPTASKLGK